MSDFEIQDQVAFVSGANRGIGRALVDVLVEKGVRRVYAGARRLDSLDPHRAAWGDRVVAVELDVTDPVRVRRAAERAADTTLLINNAGVAPRVGVSVVDPDGLGVARDEMEVNYFGLLAMTSAFAPVLERNGGGAVVNLASLASLVSFPVLPTYSASKAAVHSVTQAARLALGARGIRVAGVYPGPVDTEMADGIPMEKASPRAVAERILAGLASGQDEIFPDPMSTEMGGAFFQDPKALERSVAGMVGPG